MAASKCNFMRRATSFAAREMGCPLDHCACGTHDVENADHECHDGDPGDWYDDPIPYEE